MSEKTQRVNMKTVTKFFLWFFIISVVILLVIFKFSKQKSPDLNHKAPTKFCIHSVNPGTAHIS